MSRLHLQSRSGSYHTIVSASQQLEKAAMRIRDFGRSVRDHIATSWTRLGRNRDTTQQDLESGSREKLFSRLELSRRVIMARRTIRQETPPRPTYLLHDLHDPYSSFSPVEGVRVRVRRTASSEFSHHQLTIRAQEEFTPPGSPTGTTLGIPAEHLLDEDPEEMMGDIIQALPPNFDNPFVRPRRSLADSDESSGTHSVDSIQSSFPNVATPVTQPGSPAGNSPVRAATGASLGGNGPVVFVGGVYVTDGSNVMYICRRCGGGTAHYTSDEWDHVLKMSRKTEH